MVERFEHDWISNVVANYMDIPLDIRNWAYFSSLHD